MEWALLPYQRYSEFEGRSRRMEYWSYTLFTMIVSLILILPIIVFDNLDGGSSISVAGTISIVLFVLWVLGNVIPGIAVSIRRWHDLDQSGWMFLLFAVLNAIPFIGAIAGLVNLVWFFMQGTVGENKYGPDPK
ncbi:MAG: DUF805 domain-containing protein [Sphingorhabdus sp.]